MNQTFSTFCIPQTQCEQPLLTIGFPKASPPQNSVVLANGAVVDLQQLGMLIAQFCPGVTEAAAQAAAQAVCPGAAPVITMPVSGAIPVTTTAAAAAVPATTAAVPAVLAAVPIPVPFPMGNIAGPGFAFSMT